MLFLERIEENFFIVQAKTTILLTVSSIIDQIATHLTAHTLTHSPTSGIYPISVARCVWMAPLTHI